MNILIKLCVFYTIMNEKALQGIKVLDLSWNISGPYCTKLLAAFGAEVIKVEYPGQGDMARHMGTFRDDRPDPEAGALFLYLNTGKKSITLNPAVPVGMELLQRLIKDADVLVENFPPGHMDGLGIGYSILGKINPALIMGSITDFGQSGPYKDFRGGRLAAYALSGYMYINGDTDREPLAGGEEHPYYQGGLHAYAGVMASLHQFTVNRHVYSGKIQKRGGNRHIWSHQITVYPCKDGSVSVRASTEDQAEMLLSLIGKPDALKDPRFGSGIQRLVHADAFDAMVKPWFLARTKTEIVEACQE